MEVQRNQVRSLQIICSEALNKHSILTEDKIRLKVISADVRANYGYALGDEDQYG